MSSDPDNMITQTFVICCVCGKPVQLATKITFRAGSKFRCMKCPPEPPPNWKAIYKGVKFNAPDEDLEAANVANQFCDGDSCTVPTKDTKVVKRPKTLKEMIKEAIKK